MTDCTVLVDARLPWGSGIGRYVRNIVPPVAVRMPAVHFTLLVMADDYAIASEAVAQAANVSIRTTTIAPFSLREQISLTAIAQGYTLTWFVNYWVPLRWKGRFIATVHDLIHLDPRFPASIAKRLAAARTFAKVRRDADHVIFVSRFSARVFKADIGAPRASTIVHHGIDHMGGTAFPKPEPARGRNVLVVAAAKEHKNLPLLLGAWQHAGLNDWQLTIVSPDDDLRSSINLAEQAAKVPGVRILRGIGDDELSNLYASAGFVVVPSRYEGFGLPLIEAMYADAPVVSSTADALVEVASGALIPFVSPDDCEGWVNVLRTMAAQCGPSSTLQRSVSAHNSRIARSFTWDRAATLTAEVLENVIEGHGAARQ